MSPPDLREIRSTPLTESQQGLVERGRHMVWKVARVLQSRGASMPYDELVSLGHQGLVEAAQNYDPSFEVPFEGFAWSRVMGAMRNGMTKEWKHRHRLAAMRSALQQSTEFAEGCRDDGDPFEDSDEIALRHFRRAAEGFVAAAAMGYVHAAPHPEEAMAEQTARNEAAQAVQQAVARLPERDQIMIDRHYRDRVDLIEIAREIQVSRATIYRRHTAAIARLGEALRPE